MDDLLSHTATIIQGTLPPSLDSQVNVIYFPQLGFHITLPLDLTSGEPVYDGGEDAWERMFSTQSLVFFKDHRMRQLDMQIGDVYSIICGKTMSNDVNHLATDEAQRLKSKYLMSLHNVCYRMRRCS